MKTINQILEKGLKKAHELNVSCPNNKKINVFNKFKNGKFSNFFPFEDKIEAKEKLYHYQQVSKYFFKKVFLEEKDELFEKWLEKFENSFWKIIFSEKKIQAYLLISKMAAKEIGTKTNKNKNSFTIHQEILEYFFKEDEADIIYCATREWIDTIKESKKNIAEIEQKAENIKHKINVLIKESQTNRLTTYSEQVVEYCLKTINSCYISLKLSLDWIKKSK